MHASRLGKYGFVSPERMSVNGMKIEKKINK